MKTKQVLDILAEKHVGPVWAFFREVRSSTGFANGQRSADAIAMTLWPSRGLELNGFEVKVSRGDWLKELKNPEKAESVCKYCDRWWVVVGDKEIVKDGELPPTWGLMVPRGKKSLVVSVKAPKLNPQDVDRDFLASLLRKASEEIADPQAVKTARDRGYESGKAVGRSEGEEDAGNYKERFEDLVETVEKFERQSGVSVQDSWKHRNIAAAVFKILDMGEIENIEATLAGQIMLLKGKAERLVEGCDRLLLDQ